MAAKATPICCRAPGNAITSLSASRRPDARWLVGAMLAGFLPLCAQANTGTSKEGTATEAAQRAETDLDSTAREGSEDTPRTVDRIFRDPLSGVVVNRTVTVLGKDFYRFFATQWRQQPAAARYSISVYERPTARFGSEIWVLYRQQMVFHAFLPPARAATREISEIAVQHVLENVSKRESERLTTRNPDLGPEEL